MPQQLVIPASLRNEILKYYHDSPFGGHFSLQKKYIPKDFKTLLLGRPI